MKTLIIYSTTYGFTQDCVDKLKGQLKGEVLTANVMTEAIPNVVDFDNIIIGGSIYMGQLQKKLKTYCSQNLELLVNKSLALFLCCGLPENFEQTLKNVFPEELIKKSFAKECFGGELRTEKMKFAHKMVTRLMKKAVAKEGKSEPMLMPDNIERLAEAVNVIDRLKNSKN